MDEQVVGMIRDSLERLEGVCQGIREDMKAHIEKDEDYWKKIDAAEGQISLIKWIGGLGSGGGFLAWLFNQLKH